MNRAEKRRMDRTEAWFNSLSEDKKQIVYKMIDERVSTNDNIMSNISDVCVVSALDDVFDIDVAKITEFMSKTKEYILDYGKYLEKNGDGGIKMIENEEVRNEIKDKIRRFMGDKVDKARGLKLLKHQYDLPNAELSDLWIECKSTKFGKEGQSISKTLPDTKIEYKEQEEDLAEDSVVNSINNVVPEINVDSTKLDKLVNRAKDKDVCGLNSERVVLSPSSNLRIVSVTTMVEGLYGAYTRDIDGVWDDNKCYTDKEMVRNEKVAMVNEYKSKMDDIRKKIEVLNMDLKDVELLEMKEIERFAEIESVFDL